MAVNMLNLVSHRLLASLVILLAACPYLGLAQPPECPTGQALLSSEDPVYSDAMELKQSLESRGFVVRCVFPTKFGSIFQVTDGGIMRSTVEGEAVFRTNEGDIGAVFLPKPQTFEDFKITEHRVGDGYVYTFAGTPRVWAVNRFGSARRIYFFKHGNQLLTSDAKLRARLEEALH